VAKLQHIYRNVGRLTLWLNYRIRPFGITCQNTTYAYNLEHRFMKVRRPKRTENHTKYNLPTVYRKM
jgi:hypothetical protein